MPERQGAFGVPEKEVAELRSQEGSGERGEGANWAEGVICAVALGLGRQVAGAGCGGGWIVLAKIVFIL